MSDKCCKCGKEKTGEGGKYIEENGKQGWLCGRCFWDWLDEIRRPRERDLEAEVARLRELFRAMRKAWFDAHMKSHAHDREWEDEEDQRFREQNNESLWCRYDEQTEKIILGGSFDLTPTCGADLTVPRWPRAGKDVTHE